MNPLPSKLLAIFITFLLGYGVASYQSARAELKEEINDYQREILIASRLLEEYSENCAKLKYRNFSPYVEHATSRYELQVKKSEGFPYLMDEYFVFDHEESVFEFKEKTDEIRKTVSLCK